MSKTLYVDIQFMQTGAFDRGMGQHVRGLFKSMVMSAPKEYKAIHFVFSGNLPSDNISIFRGELERLKGNISLEFTSLDFICNNLEIAGKYDEAYAHNVAETNRYLDHIKLGQNDVWFIPCPMQEPVVPVVPSDRSIVRIVLWYDLMPYLMHDHYFPDPSTPFAYSYLSRINNLLEYDHILTISQTSKNDLVRYIAINPDTVTNTQGWINTEIVDKGELPRGVKKPFILLNASAEPNKNTKRAIEAFRLFNQTEKNKYQLVVTSGYNPEHKKMAEEMKVNALFVEHVASSSLRTLYDESQAILFPSLYEGLGLPPLEAVYLGKKLAIADIPVLRELDADDAFYWFDPKDIGDMARVLSETVKEGAALSNEQQEVYESIKQRYSWDISAKLAWDAILTSKVKPAKQRKIAVVGPHPASFSSIGKFVAELYPSLRSMGDVDYYYDQGPSDRRHGRVRFSYLQASRALWPVEKLVDHKHEYDHILYHMGNSDHHMVTYLLAHDTPATLILHDTNLSGDGLAGQMLSNGYISNDRLVLERRIESEYLHQQERFIASLVSVQKKIATHSQYANDVVEDYLLEKKPVIRVEHPMRAVEHRSEKNYQNRPIRLGIAGIMTEVKGVNTIEWLMSQTDNLRSCELYIFGFGFFADKATLRDLEAKYDNVHVDFDLTDHEFMERMANLDLLVNYRDIYKGEASRATLEAMRERVIPIVRKIGWFNELPDSVAYKLNSIEEMPQLITRLISNRTKAEAEMRSMVSAAQDLLAKKFTPEEYNERTVNGE